MSDWGQSKGGAMKSLMDSEENLHIQQRHVPHERKKQIRLYTEARYSIFRSSLARMS